MYGPMYSDWSESGIIIVQCVQYCVFPSWLHNSVTSSDKKHFVDMYQMKQGSATTSAAAYQRLPSKRPHPRDEDLEQPGPHGKSSVN